MCIQYTCVYMRHLQNGSAFNFNILPLDLLLGRRGLFHLLGLLCPCAWATWSWHETTKIYIKIWKNVNLEQCGIWGPYCICNYFDAYQRQLAYWCWLNQFGAHHGSPTFNEDAQPRFEVFAWSGWILSEEVEAATSLPVWHSGIASDSSYSKRGPWMATHYSTLFLRLLVPVWNFYDLLALDAPLCGQETFLIIVFFSVSCSLPMLGPGIYECMQ